MIPLYTKEEYKEAKSNTKIYVQCYICHTAFLVKKKYITHYLKYTKEGRPPTSMNKFCSKTCMNNSRKKGRVLACTNCSFSFYKTNAEIKRSKSGNHFCTKSCAVTYNNKHKAYGIRRSKLEIWLEQQLTQIYPDLEIHFNRKDTIDSELDIYIPSLQLAFEINGIFHYEPIFGKDKLNQIQNNDKNKTIECAKKEIDLCIIDASTLKYFKPKNAQKYLKIVVNIVNERLTTNISYS